MTALEKYLLIMIAVWRLTHFFVAEDGPFDVIIRLRKALGSGFFNELISCFYCLSVWISLVAAILTGDCLKEMIMLTLFYSGSVILLERVTNKNFE